MVRKKISIKHQRSMEQSSRINLDKVKGLSRVRPLKQLVNLQQAALEMLECLQNNDPDGAMKMISIYLVALNKAKLHKESNLPKSTMYSALKHRNPTIKTLAKIM
jgi:DNA-binding phage protein